MLALAFVEVDGVWTEEIAWSSPLVSADVPSCCCEFMVGFGWESDEGPRSSSVFPDVLECAGNCTLMAAWGDVVPLASLEVDGAQAGTGSSVETPEDALL